MRLSHRPVPDADDGAHEPQVVQVARVEARMVCTQIFALVKFFSVSSQFYDGESLVEWTARLVNDF